MAQLIFSDEVRLAARDIYVLKAFEAKMGNDYVSPIRSYVYTLGELYISDISIKIMAAGTSLGSLLGNRVAVYKGLHSFATLEAYYMMANDHPDWFRYICLARIPKGSRIIAGIQGGVVSDMIVIEKEVYKLTGDMDLDRNKSYKKIKEKSNFFEVWNKSEVIHIMKLDTKVYPPEGMIVL